LHAKHFQSREHAPKHDLVDFYTTIHFESVLHVKIYAQSR